MVQMGDIVARLSYDCDVLFRVERLPAGSGDVELLGDEWRLLADAPLGDLKVLDQREVQRWKKKIRKKEEDSLRLFRQDYQLLKLKREYTATGGYAREDNYFELPGRVLHIDGDAHYLKKCLELYGQLGIPVSGLHVQESDMAEQVRESLGKTHPNILVLTGHDAYRKNQGSVSDLGAYRHTRDFIRAVREARAIESNPDELVVFAGACQSHFEALIRAGSNYASSPGRINIHALDPVYIAAKVSLTSFTDRITVWEALRNTLAKEKGLGGIETRGLLRTGMPIEGHASGSDFSTE